MAICMETLLSTYYDRPIGHGSASFSNFVQIGEHIEDSLKTGKIKDYYALFNQSSNGIGGSTEKTVLNRKSEEGEK